jgi:hypothetical protein
MTTIVIENHVDNAHRCDLYIDGIKIEAQRFTVDEYRLTVWFRAEIIIDHSLSTDDTVIVKHIIA